MQFFEKKLKTTNSYDRQVGQRSERRMPHFRALHQTGCVDVVFCIDLKLDIQDYSSAEPTVSRLTFLIESPSQ